MTRRQRTELMASCDSDFLKKLASIVEKEHDIQTIEEPNSGMVMLKMRENAKKHLFYLGELFVTECKVMINGQIGLGILQGAHKKKALYMAIVDAAYNAQSSVVTSLNRLLENEKTTIHHRKRQSVETILKTKVDFETLDEEVKA